MRNTEGPQDCGFVKLFTFSFLLFLPVSPGSLVVANSPSVSLSETSVDLPSSVSLSFLDPLSRFSPSARVLRETTAGFASPTRKDADVPVE